MILAIDIGNTNIKCKAWSEDQVLFVKRFSLVEIDLMTNYLINFSPDVVVVGCVGSDAVENTIREIFPSARYRRLNSQSFCMEVLNGYEDPVKLGVDRWLAVIEAYHDAEKNDCCVFDLGTALTLDIVDKVGQHKGGYIVPGLTLMRESLLSSTQKVRYEPKEAMGLGYASNTVDAVERGTFAVILSWMKSEIESFKQVYPDGDIYLTGGGAKSILPFLGFDVNYREDLVLDALKRIASN